MRRSGTPCLTPALAAPALIAAVALLPAVPAAAQQAPAAPMPVPMVPATGTLLDVVAEGRSTRAPDLATIRAGVVTDAPTAAQALRDNAAAMTRVMAALRRAGSAERDIQTATVRLAPQYRYADNQPPVVTGYQATNSVAIRFRDVAAAGGILDALVAQGANQIDGPDLSVADPEAALDAARTDAVARARARADLYARAAGLRVGRIVSITEAGQNDGGADQPPVAFARAAGGRANKTPVAAGEKEITATLQVRFLLER